MPLTDDYGSVQWFSAKGATNGTSAQTVISDPGTGAQPYIVPTGAFNFLNRDTASVTMILTITGGTSRIIERVSLSIGDKFVNDGQYIVSAGETLTVELSAAATSVQSTWACGYFQTTN